MGHASTSRNHQKEPQNTRERGLFLVVSTGRPSARCAVVSGTARVIRGKLTHYPDATGSWNNVDFRYNPAAAIGPVAVAGNDP